MKAMHWIKWSTASLLLAVVLAGCCEPTEEQDLGTIESVDVKMGSFNSCDFTVVKTDKNTVQICGHVRRIPLHKKLFVSRDCGSKIYTIDGKLIFRETK